MDVQFVQRAEQDLRRRFGNAKRVAEYSVLAELKVKNSTVAAYWFDFRDDLPQSSEDLRQYVDELVGPVYFSDDRPNDLRWSHYIYFVMSEVFFSSPGHDRRSSLAEADRSFARKFVIPTTGFEGAIASIGKLDVPALTSSQVTSVVEGWRTALNQADLEFLADEEITLVDRVRRVCAEPVKSGVQKSKIVKSKSGGSLSESMLEWIDLSNFRHHPSRKRVEGFGVVNLIVGPNGAGKTSLMEAIEYLYCGGTLRNPAQGGFEVTAGLKNGKEVHTVWQKDFKESRGRLLEWYAQHDSSRKNALPSAFSRFNFLNTDAAAALTLGRGDRHGDEREDILQALNQLIGGEDATALEKQLRRSLEAISEEERKRSVVRDSLRKQIQAAKDQLEYLGNRPKQADADAGLLREQLRLLNWSGDATDQDLASPSFRTALQDAAIALSSVREVPVDPPLMSLRELRQCNDRLEDAVRVADSAKADLHDNEDEARNLAKEIAALKTQADLIGQLSLSWAEYARQNFVSIKRVQTRRAELSRLVTGLSVVVDQSTVDRFIDSSVPEALERLYAQYKFQQEEANAADSRWRLAQKQEESLGALRSQIVSMGRELLKHSADHDNCPLCGTHFDSGELAKRLVSIVPQGGDRMLADLASMHERARYNLHQTGLQIREIEGLAEFNRRRGRSRDLVAPSLRDFTTAKTEFAAVEEEFGNLQRIHESLRYGAWSVEEVFEVIGVRNPFDDDLSVALEVAKARAIEKVRDAELRSAELEDLAAKHFAELSAIAKDLGVTMPENAADASALYRKLRRQVQAAMSYVANIEKYVHISDVVNVEQLVNTIRSALLQVERLIEAASSEASAELHERTLQDQCVRLKDQSEKNDAAIERLSGARRLTSDLLENQSLALATQDALIAVHDVADRIFSRIHVPSEYRISSEVQHPLSRKDDEVGVDLSEVSTGQRAAYALSIFLSMNSRMARGPKIILLDDPIAHVDDLNALSFIDYLRDVALNMQRQIFFATADDKIAGLFAHKFQFLGSDFKAIDLARQSSSQSDSS